MQPLRIAAAMPGVLAAWTVSAAAGPVPARGAGSVARVRDVHLVCMVNDRFMGTQQIPVKVEGRTYYGCCEMCKTRLWQDKTVRYAQDPVTGKAVDKATAVIGRRPDGSVLYFESATSLARYNRQRRGPA
jgi:YHS domain-containing protein